MNGPRDVGTLAAQAGLAWCMSLVQHSEGVKIFEEVQELQKGVLDENHSEILSSRVGLGRAYLLLANQYYKQANALKIKSQRREQGRRRLHKFAAEEGQSVGKGECKEGDQYT